MKEILNELFFMISLFFIFKLNCVFLINFFLMDLHNKFFHPNIQIKYNIHYLIIILYLLPMEINF